jgi:hypothetical protein
MEIQSNISKKYIDFIYFKIIFSYVSDQCYCCQLRLTGKSIQFAIRSQPFQDGNIYKRPCLICRNFMSEQIHQIKYDKKNFDENK